jgi:hypothetical protein
MEGSTLQLERQLTGIGMGGVERNVEYCPTIGPIIPDVMGHVAEAGMRPARVTVTAAAV